MKIIYILLMSFLVGIITACDSGKNKSDTASDTTSAQTETGKQTKISITPVTNSQEFPDAIIELQTPGQYAEVKPGKINFEFEVKNYVLGQQTTSPFAEIVANSKQGQHIHLILNNQPYMAHYQPKFEVELEDGHYIALAFLSRSYHEGLKTYGAAVLRQFTVGANTGKDVDLTQPMLFYSRPAGEYSGNETKQVLLDFYLMNTELAADGYKVKATINEEVFLIDKWQAYWIEGLPIGENTIKIELIDKNGNLINKDFNSIERKITISGHQL